MRRIAIVLLFAAFLISACSAGAAPTASTGGEASIAPAPSATEATESTVEPTTVPTAEPTPTPVPTASPTPVPTPEPTPVPLEDRVAGSCEFLEEQYCGQGTEIDLSGVVGPDGLFGASRAMAFNLPAGTPVFAPISGAEMGTGIASEAGTSRAVLIQQGAVAPGDVGNIQAEYVFFFEGASSEGSMRAGSIPVGAGEILGVLTGELTGPPINPTGNEYNLIVLVP